MTDTTNPIVEPRTRPGAIAHEVRATREPVALTDRGRTIAVVVGPADALESEEMRALEAYRAHQARGADDGVPHAEAYRRIFGGDKV